MCIYCPGESIRCLRSKMTIIIVRAMSIAIPGNIRKRTAKLENDMLRLAYAIPVNGKRKWNE